MGMGPSVKTINNRATPLANDFISYLQGMMTPSGPLQQGAIGGTTPSIGGMPGRTGGIPGGFGGGVGSAQQSATSGIQSAVDNFSGSIGSGGLDPGTQAMIDAIIASSDVATNRSAANQREMFGAAGSRFGTQLGGAEALLRSEAGMGRDLQIGEVLQTRQTSNEANLMNALAMLSQQGMQNIAPYLLAMEIGTAPAENVVSPGVGSQILSGLLSAGGSFLGGWGAGRGMPKGLPGTGIAPPPEGYPTGRDPKGAPPQGPTWFPGA